MNVLRSKGKTQHTSAANQQQYTTAFPFNSFRRKGTQSNEKWLNLFWCWSNYEYSSNIVRNHFWPVEPSTNWNDNLEKRKEASRRLKPQIVVIVLTYIHKTNHLLYTENELKSWNEAKYLNEMYLLTRLLKSIVFNVV